MKAVPSIMKFHDGADPIQDYKHSLKKKSRDLKKEDELNGTVSEDIADKLYDSLIFKSNEHKPTVVSHLRNYISGDLNERCDKCYKLMKRMRTHSCIESLQLRHLAQTWPRLNGRLVCIFGCQCVFTNYRKLAEHYLEHNWRDLKFFGIHPRTLRQVVEEKVAST